MGNLLLAMGNLVLRLCMPKQLYDDAWEQHPNLMHTIQLILCIPLALWLLLLPGVYICGKNLSECMDRYSPALIQHEITLMVLVAVGPPLLVLLIRLLLWGVERSREEKTEKE